MTNRAAVRFLSGLRKYAETCGCTVCWKFVFVIIASGLPIAKQRATGQRGKKSRIRAYLVSVPHRCRCAPYFNGGASGPAGGVIAFSAAALRRNCVWHSDKKGHRLAGLPVRRWHIIHMMGEEIVYGGIVVYSLRDCKIFFNFFYNDYQFVAGLSFCFLQNFLSNRRKFSPSPMPRAG